MALAEVALGTAAWALTYALHSTLLLAGVWLLTRRESLLSPRLRERLWRTAALGALVTASLQVGLGWQPAGASWTLALVEPELAALDTPTELSRPLLGTRPGHAAARLARPTDGALLHMDGQPPAVARTLAPLRGELAPTRDRLRATLVAALLLGLGLWAAAAALGLTRLARTALRLRDRLRGRLVLERGPLRERFDRLGASPRVELAVCPTLALPITTGVWRHRVCLPLRALTDLSPAAQECMLAHELAHARRRDGAWLLGFLVLEALLPFQPLNRLARRRASDAAEFLCDAWAVRRTGRPLDLARCLTQVATWVVGTRQPVLPAPGMAGQASSLGRRVEHLIEPARRPLLSGRGLAWTPLLLSSLGAVALAAPGVELRVAEAPEAEAVVLAELVELPAPASAPAPAPDLDLAFAPDQAGSATDASAELLRLAALLEIFTLLEAELAALQSEFALLDQEVRSAPIDPELSAFLDRFRGRVASLGDRRDRARDLLAGLLERASREAPLSRALIRP